MYSKYRASVDIRNPSGFKIYSLISYPPEYLKLPSLGHSVRGLLEMSMFNGDLAQYPSFERLEEVTFLSFFFFYQDLLESYIGWDLERIGRGTGVLVCPGFYN